MKTHPLIERYGYRTGSSMHAELAVCIKYGHLDCTDLSLVVVRIRSSGKSGYSRPCKRCTEMLRILDFKEVWYSTDCETLERLYY